MLAAIFGLVGVTIGGLLVMVGNLLIEHQRECNRRKCSLGALLAELEFNLQLLGSINAGELHYTKLEQLVEFVGYEQARDTGALAHLPSGVLLEIASARLELMVFCGLAQNNPSLPFPQETSVGDGYNLKKYLSGAHTRLLNVSEKLRGYLG